MSESDEPKRRPSIRRRPLSRPPIDPLTEEEIRRILQDAEEKNREYTSQGFTPSLYPLGNQRKPDTPFTEAEVVQFQLLIQEQARRRKESLRLYVPLPFQDDFHRSDAPERSIRASNRAGKTLAAAVEAARAVTNQDPHGKYPSSGRMVIVGKDEKHCGEVLYRKLFKPGAYRVIRDEITREWRPYDPETDYARRKQRRLSPPLIPHRFYSDKDMSWSKKKEEIPKKAVINAGKPNEWEMHFFSSLGEAPQGIDVDVIWFDEEIEHPSWYTEMAMRLIDRAEWDDAQDRWIGGKFFWSATPQAGTLRLFKIHKRAGECLGLPKPSVTEHTATMFDNPFLSQKAKDQAVEKLGGNEDEIRVRIYGEFALAGMRVYPEFTPDGAHGCEAFPIPDDWCRYIAIDPGRQVCAVLFAAVPPPSHPDRRNVFLYDELYIKRCDAEKFAEALAAKISGTPIWEALIDHHAGRVTEMGSGKTIEEQYRVALEKRHVRFEHNNSAHFTWGSDDVDARILAVRSGLHIVDGKSARWVVFRDRCPNFIWEIENYCYKKDVTHNVVTDKPLAMDNHLMDDIGYMAAHGLPYRRPRARKRRGSYAFQYLEDKKRRHRDSGATANSIKVC